MATSNLDIFSRLGDLDNSWLFNLLYFGLVDRFHGAHLCTVEIHDMDSLCILGSWLFNLLYFGLVDRCH